MPERLIGAEASFYLRWCIEHRSGTKGLPIAEAMKEYEHCFTADTIRATCEEFRAATSVDLEHDETDKHKKFLAPHFYYGAKTACGQVSTS